MRALGIVIRFCKTVIAVVAYGNPLVKSTGESLPLPGFFKM